MNTATTSFARLAALIAVFSFIAFPVRAQVAVEDPAPMGGNPALRGEGATFEWLGVLSRQNGHSSFAQAMTPDGSVVVGYSSSEDPDDSPFRWEDGEMQALEVPPESGWFRILNVSSDGSVIVGVALNVSRFPFTFYQAVRWIDGEAEFLECIEEPSGIIVCPASAMDVSGDGATIVGWASVLYPNGVDASEPFRMTEGEGLVRLPTLPPPPGENPFSGAELITADGSVIIGMSVSSRGPESVRWINDEIALMEGLPADFFTGRLSSYGDITPDGSVIVGWRVATGEAYQYEAIRWEDGEFVNLGTFDGTGLGSMATDVSADGSIVVGGSDFEGISDQLLFGPFIWTEAGGMRNLQTVLEEDYDIDLSDSFLGPSQAISYDGRVIVGYGITPDGYPEAWRVVFEQPIADEPAPTERADVLTAAKPNPVRASTTLSVNVAETQRVKVEVFDVTGRRVQTLYDGALAAGTSQRLALDASALPPGVYVIRATGEDFSKTRRVTVVR